MRAGTDGPELVRRAHGPLGRERLAREVRRLTEAAHPGVVPLLDHDEDHLVLGWVGGTTLETERPEVAGVAAITASIAATIADLHRLGIVHGRLDPSHVVLGADGHPRLCGLRGTDPDDPDAAPADDVAAIGALLDRFLSRDSELEPIPERRWGRRRWAGYERRALQMLADRATDPDPARRPTASDLARAITEAVPGAAFEPNDADPPGSTPAGPVAGDATATEAPSADAEPASAEPAVAGDGLPGHPEDEAITFDPAESKPASTTPEHALSSPIAPPPEEPRRESMPEHPSGASTSSTKKRSAPMIDPFAPPAAHPDTSVRDPDVDTPRPIAARDDSTVPMPPRPLPNRPGAPSRRGTVVGFGAVGLALVILGALRIASAGPPDDGTAESVTADASAVECELDSGPDIDGDGCPDDVEVDGNAVIVAGRRYVAGEVGDRVRVADWNCDGTATVALLRPNTGEVFAFPDWDVDTEGSTVHAVTTVDDAVDLLEPEDDRCLGLVLRRDGRTVDLDLNGAS